MYPFHLWLPEAHVEASTIGSVLLASILLKLGGFGCFQFVLPATPFPTKYFLPLIEVLSCLGFFYCAIGALVQLDFKKIIAYSSVVHMHLVIFAIFSFNHKAFLGSFLLMLSHGFTSAGIFFALGSLYDRFGTRNILYLKGLVYTMPLFTSIFFLLILSNIGFPGTLNFISEILSLAGILLISKSCNLIFLFLGLLINTFYNFYFYSRLAFGNFTVALNNSSQLFSFNLDLNKNEFFVLCSLVLINVFLGFFPGLLTQTTFIWYSFLTLKLTC